MAGRALVEGHARPLQSRMASTEDYNVGVGGGGEEAWEGGEVLMA